MQTITTHSEAPKPAKTVKAKPVKAAKPANDKAKPAPAAIDPDARRNPDARRSVSNLVIPTAENAAFTIAKNTERYTAHVAALKARYGFKPFTLAECRSIRYVNPHVACPSSVLGDAAVIARLIGYGSITTDTDGNLLLTNKRI